MDRFGDRAVEAVRRTGPLCAGIDPSAALLGAWGLPDDAGGLRSFGRRCIAAYAGVVPVVKAQVAFFERHGSPGYAALEELLAEARHAGLLVIADAKRGDIGSTSSAYAAAWLDGSSPLAADAVTVTPYLGLGALAPMIEAARTGGRGIFVVVRSSNPEGRALQQAVLAGGSSVEDGLLAEIAGLNRAELTTAVPGERTGVGLTTAVPGERTGVGLTTAVPGERTGVGSVGAVVGATLVPSRMSLSLVGGMILAPGVGAQGADPADVAALFAGCPPGTVLPSASRSLLAAGPSVGSLRAAAVAVRDEMAVALA